VVAWWKQLQPRQRWGGALAAVGAGLTVLLAFLSNQHKPPAASTQALIALLAILAQLGSAWAFSGVGKADPGLAERSVARLVGLATRASLAKAVAEKCRGTNPGVPASAIRQAMGELSVHLSYLEEGYLDAIDDWRVFHPDAVNKAERSEDDRDR
jgi:hypothetical protein